MQNQLNNEFIKLQANIPTMINGILPDGYYDDIVEGNFTYSYYEMVSEVLRRYKLDILSEIQMNNITREKLTKITHTLNDLSRFDDKCDELLTNNENEEEQEQLHRLSYEINSAMLVLNDNKDFLIWNLLSYQERSIR